jgi:hypothetical protein
MQPRCSSGVIIWEGHIGSSSVPPHVKKEAEVKEEMSAPKEDELPWLVQELTMANAARHPNKPADETGLHMLQARLLNEPQPMDDKTRPRLLSGQRRRAVSSSTSPRTTTALRR